ncbi:Pyruvate phosphate dikinase PEP/pyruvate-binding protein [Desulfosarcina cetonica]|nr:Pyruvate phosphate dikinase PEP/pyruvate-binding protein [Desulfosarcina cetonica]
MTNWMTHLTDRMFMRRQPRESVSFVALFQTFKHILTLNNQILESIADMGDKLGGDYVFDRQYIRASSRQVGLLVDELIYHFNILAPQKYRSLDTIARRIRRDIEEELAGRVVIPQTEYVIPYDIVTSDLDDVVGGKNAHIAEIRNRLGIAVPEGFAITTRAYQCFLDHNQLQAPLSEILSDWQAGRIALDAASAKLLDRFAASTLPPPLTRAIKRALKPLQQKNGRRHLLLAVRSSAMGEDGEHSFAGQYRSLLNQTPQDLLESYKTVLASAFSPSAMAYRQQKGIAEAEVAMAVACQEMIDATVSGVLYSLDPSSPSHDTMTISAAWGLGGPIVDGTMEADRFTVSREFPHSVVQREIVPKPRQLVSDPAGGCTDHSVDEADQMRPALSDDQVKALAETALVIERYFKCPQDIEWAFDQQGRLVILQARALNIALHVPPAMCDIASLSDRHPVIFSGRGIIVQNGIATGKAFIVRNDKDLNRFPNGSILVAKKTSPRYAKVACKASGIITDVGSATGHMATIAREFRIPTVVNTHMATALLTTGQEITLDAQENIVYEGRIQALCYYGFMEEAFEETYEYRLLRRILKKITPLNLVDPHARNFTPQACRSFHDITRFIHEKAVEELANLNYQHRWHDETASRKLALDIPLDLVVIDINNGLGETENESETDGHARVTRDQIRSVPMKAFLDGLCAPGVWSREPMSVDFSSFMSSLTRTFSSHVVNPQQVGQNLAVISENYANINLRLGYHFNLIDAYIGEQINDNYAYFRFMGGVTDPQRRSRRARLIYETLAQYDFNVDLRGDLVIGRIKKLDARWMAKKMVLLGRLVGFTRQLDVKMTSDAQVGAFAREFKKQLKMDQPIKGG